MLKKLVRYGNSNALVLDKAILELLNIAEGSVVKISTDGRSIILTPHQEAATLPVNEKEAATLPVNETFTSDDALTLANIKESMKSYKNLDPQVRKDLEQEMLTLTNNHKALVASLASNKAYQQEQELLRSSCPDFDQRLKMTKALMEKHAPGIDAYQKVMLEFDKKCRLMAGMETPEDMAEKQEQMTNAFQELFSKNKNVFTTLGTAMNSPEYQHKAQLLTEKYEGDQSSSEFIKEMQQLMYEFCPAMEALHQDVAAVTKKHSTTH